MLQYGCSIILYPTLKMVVPPMPQDALAGGEGACCQLPPVLGLRKFGFDFRPFGLEPPNEKSWVRPCVPIVHLLSTCIAVQV